MLLVARDERQPDLGLGDVDRRSLAAMLDVDDVHALLGDEIEELQQLAGPVGHPRAYDEIAARLGQAMPHNRDERRRVDVPSRQDDGDGARSLDPAGEQRRHARRAGAFDDELRPLEAEHDRLRDLPARDLDHVVAGRGSCSPRRRAPSPRCRRLPQSLRDPSARPQRESRAWRARFLPRARHRQRGRPPPPRRRAGPPSSRPTVPWPATTTGSSNAWMYVAPADSAWSWPACTACSKPSPTSSTSAP